MTVEQALQILDKAAAEAELPRSEHIVVQRAVQILAEAIKQEECQQSP